MPRYIVNRNNFLGGELSKRSDGRTDLPQYQLGCKQLRNFIVMPDGGVAKRPGFRFVTNLDENDTEGTEVSNARVLPFVFSETESYVATIYDYFDGANTEVTARILNTSGTDETINVDSDVTTQQFVGNGMQYAQAGDVMILCGAGQRPWVLYRTNRGTVDLGLAYDFALVDYLWGSGFGVPSAVNEAYKRMPFRDENLDTSLQLDPSGTTGDITITSNFDAFTTESVGAYYRIGTGYVEITGFTDVDEVTATVIKDLGGVAAEDDWAESAWSDRRGWPRSVTFYNGRLAFGGNDSQPDTIWLSAVGNYFLFEPIGTGVDDPMNYTLTSERVNQIQWMNGGKKLIIGTAGSEHVGSITANGTTLNVTFNQETAHGSAYIQAKRVAYAIPFVQQSQHRVRELVFDFNSDSYVANDLTLLRNDIAEGFWNENLAENAIIGTAYMDSPYPIIWYIDSAGYLYGVTRDRSQQIVAWHTHLIGGHVREDDITGKMGEAHQSLVKSICCIPTGRNNGYRLYAIVARHIDGKLKYYLEFMDQFRDWEELFFSDSSEEACFYYLDSAKYSCPGGSNFETPTDTFTGFDHLKNEDVGVMVDGKWCGEHTVDSNGVITLNNGLSGFVCIAGYPYNARLKTTRTEGGSVIGSSVGSIRRADRISIHLHKSRFFDFGFEYPATIREEILGTSEWNQVDFYDSRLESHNFIDPNENPGSPYYTFSGHVTRPVPAGYDDKCVAIVLSKLPYPCNILGITIRAVEQDV